MKRVYKRILLGIASVVVVGALTAGTYAFAQARAFDNSMSKVYPLALPSVTRSTDAAVLGRGKHLAESIGGCAARDCHGSDYSGGKTLSLGPLGDITGPNITSGGMLAVYSDGELARLIKAGVKKDGRSVRMMPVPDFSWLPQTDIDALVSYLRSVPASNKPSGPVRVGLLGKVLDRQGLIALDIARAVQALPQENAPAPEPTRDYGRFLVRGCTGCHGDTLSGGPIPGAPPSLPTPLNITMHESGIKDYTFDDFVRLLKTGVRKNGRQLDPFMAIELTRNLDETELKALWAELQARPPKAFGGR